jgi:hypothetical protein
MTKQAHTQTPLERLRYHVTGAIERGESAPVVDVTAPAEEDAQATATSYNQRHRWGIEPAVLLALEVLEDCNAHSLAAVLLEAAKRKGVAP